METTHFSSPYHTREELLNHMKPCLKGGVLDVEGLITLLDEAMLSANDQVSVIKEFFGGEKDRLFAFLTEAEKNNVLKAGALHLFAVEFGIVQPATDEVRQQILGQVNHTPRSA